MSAAKSPSAKREALGACLDELDRAVAAAARLGKHLRALVDADHRAAFLANELARDRTGPGCHIEHVVTWAGFDPRDEKSPPARVLPVREERGVVLVGRAERREDPLCLLGAFHYER